MTNENKLSFLQRFNKGENFNTVKTNAIRKAKELAKVRKNKNEENRLAREKANQNAKNEANRLAKENANRKAENNRLIKEKENQNVRNEEKRLANIKAENNRLIKEKENKNAKNEANRLAKEKANQNAKNEANREGRESKRLFIEAQEKKEANRLAKEKANQNAKNEANRLAKEKANQNAKNEANRKAKEEEAIRKEKEKKQKLLSKILNNSKNLTNVNKMEFLKRFEKGDKFNTVKKNAISKAKELAKQRKAREEEERKAREKEEANRKAKEEMIAKKKEEALAKKKKEDEEKKKKEAENKKKAAQNTQMRASLTKKVKETQMNQKVKNKLLNQLKNYSVQIRNVAPGIEQTIKSEKLNGNYNNAENRKKRQEVKKQLATYISKTYPNMSKANRGKYIKRANLTQWRKGFLTGSQGMGVNQAFERIKGNIRENMKAKKPPPPQKNKKANLKKLVNNTMKGRAAKNVNRLKKNINEGVSEMTVKTRLAQLNKQTKYQK